MKALKHLHVQKNEKRVKNTVLISFSEGTGKKTAPQLL